MEANQISLESYGSQSNFSVVVWKPIKFLCSGMEANQISLELVWYIIKLQVSQ